MPLSSGTVDTTGSDIQDPDLNKIARWVAEIVLYDRETQSWYERSKRIIRRYRDERSPREDKAARYNVLWANTQTLMPAYYAHNPKPDIQRRYKDADPVGRVTSDVLERCVTYFADTDIFGATIRQSVLDLLLPGRGTVWLRYVPHTKQVPAEVTDDAEPQMVEVLTHEEVLTDYVHARDFGHNICRTWEEVNVIWRIVYMTRAELVKRFGEEKGAIVPLDHVATSNNGIKLDDGIGKATIYELWDKTRQCAVWFHKTIPEALDLRPDPLKLDKFFPSPRPLFSNVANDSLIPTPDYVEYQDQAMELDNLTSRIASITKSIKVAGAYDASVQALGSILSEGVDNTMIPVESWAIFSEKGGIAGAMSFLPIQDIAAALLQLYSAREQVKKDLHEISGIPDVVRGDSDPNETLGAQQIKTSFATNRISDRQREVQRFVRETIRIMVDIICNHFQMDTIKEICGVRLLTNQEKQIGQQMIQQAQQTGQPPQLPPGLDMETAERLMTDPSWEDIEKLLRNNVMRGFRIDIETDSTIKADQEADKMSRIEFLKAVGGFLQQAQQAGAAQPEMVPVLGQMLMFGVRAFPVGKELEGSLDAAIKKLEKEAQNPQPKPNPEMQKMQGEQQMAQQKMQMDQQARQADAQAQQAKVQGDIAVQHAKIQSDMQLAQQKMQNEMQIERARIQAKQASEQAEMQSSSAIDQHENELEAQREHAKLQQEMQIAQMRIAAEADLQLKLAHIRAASAIEVARIGAAKDDGADAEAREASGE